MQNFKVGDCNHNLGDKRCPECWSGFPTKCECGGLIHAQFLKKDLNTNAIHILSLCEKCKDKFKEHFNKKKKKFLR